MTTKTQDSMQDNNEDDNSGARWTTVLGNSIIKSVTVTIGRPYEWSDDYMRMVEELLLPAPKWSPLRKAWITACVVMSRNNTLMELLNADID